MQRRSFAKAAAGLGLLLGGLLAGSLSGGALAADTPVIDSIKKDGVIKVGLGTFVPWAFTNKDGKLVGFEVDVATRLAKDLGVTLELVPTGWDAIIPSLGAGKFDVIIGGLTITPERAKSVDFTIPYEHSQTYIVVNKKVAPNLTTLEQIDSPDVSIARRRGAASAAKETFPKAKSLLFDDENTQQQEFFNGNVTAILVSTPTPALLVEQQPDLARIIEPAVEQTDEAFAIRPGDKATLEAFNGWIKARTDDGWLKERYDYWFKGRAWADQVASN